MNTDETEIEIKKTEKTAIEVYGSFFLNSSEFALPVKSIQEVVNPPEKLNSMPLAPGYMLGIFNLRGAIIPVIDLKKILSMEDQSSQAFANRKIAIVDIGGLKVGLLFDQTGQIFRNQNGAKSDFSYSGEMTVPQKDRSSSVSKESRPHVIAGALKLDNGQRIVQILDPHSLIHLEGVPLTQASALGASDQMLRRKNQGIRKQCISFQVHAGHFGLGIEAIQEILRVPNIKESPLGSKICIGLLELRGDVIPVIDFAALLKYQEKRAQNKINDEHRIIIMKLGDEKFGLLIDSVQSIVSFYSEEILQLPLLTSEKSSIFLGCLSKTESEQLILLNHHEILSSQEIADITQGHSELYKSQSAKDLEGKKSKAMRKTFITFKIETLLALRIDEVVEIIEYSNQIMQPPGVQKFIKGMLNLRNKMVTIIDSKVLYGMKAETKYESAKIIIFNRNGSQFGLIVDSVENIMGISEDQLMDLPKMLQHGVEVDIKSAAEVLLGETKTTLFLLDLDRLFMKISAA